MANSWGAFNPNNLGGKTLDSLRNDIYAGFRTKSVPRYEMRGAGRDGRRRVQTGYSQQFNANYYKDHPGWRGIGDKLGININSQNDVRQLFDYVNGYKPPAQAAPKAAAPAPAPYKPTPLATPYAPKQVQFNTSAYDKQIADLSKNLTTIQEALKTNQSAYAKTIADQKSFFEQTTLANQSSFDKLFQNQQAGFDSQLAKQSDAFNAEMAAQTTKYDNNMSALKNSLAATLSSKDAPTLGVKSAALSPKNLAMQHQGIRGTFGRSGLRIKGIKDKSLNI